MRLLTPLLVLAFSSPAHAGKPTAAEACAHIVEVQNAAYSVTPEASAVQTFEAACQQVLEGMPKKQAKDVLACVVEESDAAMLVNCGEPVSQALAAANPMGPSLRAACDHQVKVTAAHVGAMSEQTRATVHAGCIKDLELQLQLLPPEDMARKTKCMATAKDQAASEACWE